MKSRDEFMDKAEELVSKENPTPVDREAAAILIELAGYEPEDFVNEHGALGLLHEYKRGENETVMAACDLVEKFIL